MSETFNFELVSPEARLVSEPAQMVTIPGEEGDIGVLAQHTPLVATIRPGVIEVYTENKEKPARKIFIAGGFADVGNEHCTVLAEQAIALEDLDKGELEKQLSQLEEDLKLAEGESDTRRFERRIKIVKAKLFAIAA